MEPTAWKGPEKWHRELNGGMIKRVGKARVSFSCRGPVQG